MVVRIGAALPKLNISKGTETGPELAGSIWASFFCPLISFQRFPL